MTPTIIAEIAQGYEGNARLVDRYVKAIAGTGADAIKFQIFFADELALPDYQYYNLFKGLELPFTVWKKAVSDAHTAGLAFYSDIFGVDSLRELIKIEIDGVKIHATDINNTPLLREVARTRKPTLLATGGCELAEIERALEILSACPVTLMCGFQAEPTEVADNNLLRIGAMKEKFGRPVGFMDHTAGDSDLCPILPYMALGAGATLIEKHVTLSRKAQLEDYISALTAEEFAVWSTQLKRAASALGAREWVLTEKERTYRKKVKRAVCTVGELGAGCVIGPEDIALKRTSDPEAIYDVGEVVGKKLKGAVAKNALVKKGVIDHHR